jgi:hypothetical protein
LNAGAAPVLVGAWLLLAFLIVLNGRSSQSLLRRDWMRQIALLAALTVALVAGLSCGGGGGVSSPPSESGTVTVQGTGPSTSHSVTISVSVD